MALLTAGVSDGSSREPPHLPEPLKAQRPAGLGTKSHKKREAEASL